MLTQRRVVHTMRHLQNRMAAMGHELGLTFNGRIDEDTLMFTFSYKGKEQHFRAYNDDDLSGLTKGVHRTLCELVATPYQFAAHEMLAKRELERSCFGIGHLTELPTTESNASATSVGSGGSSTNSESSAGATSESVPPVDKTESSRAFEVDGWVCDDANPFRHTATRTMREIRRADGTEWPAALVLTVGDGPENRRERVEVSERALRWLLTGQAPTEENDK